MALLGEQASRRTLPRRGVSPVGFAVSQLGRLAQPLRIFRIRGVPYGNV